jgi:hypothetical protein
VIPRDFDMEARQDFQFLVQAARNGCNGICDQSLNRCVKVVGGYEALRRLDAHTLLPAFTAAWRAERIALWAKHHALADSLQGRKS